MYNRLHLDNQRRVLDLLAPLSADELSRRPPACPLWSVRDILAQLTGGSAALTGGPSVGEPASDLIEIG